MDEEEQQQIPMCEFGMNTEQMERTEIDLETGEFYYDEKEISRGQTKENFVESETEAADRSENDETGCPEGTSEERCGGSGTPAASLKLPAGKGGMYSQSMQVKYLDFLEMENLPNSLSVITEWPDIGEEPFTANDYGNARRFLEKAGGLVRYCPEEKCWYRYGDHRWVRKSIEEMQKMVRDALFTSYDEELEQLVAENRGLEQERSKKEKLKCGRMSSIKNCLEAAALDLIIHTDDFDRDIYRFHAQNGSIDLKHFSETMYHQTGDYFTKMANARIITGGGDAQEKCPLWTEFVKQCCMYDDELYRYVQAAAGYSILTGDIREQKVFCLLGSGRNGKSLFINVLAYVAGDYAKKLESSVLCTDRYGRKSDETEKELYRIRGSRFVYSNEFSQNSILNEAFLKAITDGGRISCRTLYKESIEYVPTYTLWFSTNHMPNLQAIDEGIRRRIMVIPFRNHLSETEIDRNLEAKLLREADGILSWLGQGYLHYHHLGLDAPKAVVEATQGYFEEQDVFRRFLDENYEIETEGRIMASALYQHYVDWCKINGEKEVSKLIFSKQMERLNVEKKKISQGTCYLLRKVV